MHSLTVGSRSSLYWVEPMQGEGTASGWCVSALESDLTLTLCMDQMSSCRNEGQWVVAELSCEGDEYRLSELRPLPGNILRSQLEQQIEWAGGQQQRTLVQVLSPPE